MLVVLRMSVLSRLKTQSNQKNPYEGLHVREIKAKVEWVVILRKIQLKGEEPFLCQELKRIVTFVCPLK